MKGKPRQEDIESRKSVIIVFSKGKSKKMYGLTEELELKEKGIFAKVKPLIIQASFEGNVIPIMYQEKNIEKLLKKIKEFESSKDEVLIISGDRTSVMSKKQLNHKLNSMLQKMFVSYQKELDKTLKDDYIA